MLAPPSTSGVSEVVRLLSEALGRRAHHVTLFDPPGDGASADADHVARAFSSIFEAQVVGEPYDIVHDHCGSMVLAMADRIETPFVHTAHGPFTDDNSAFYAAHGHKATVVGLSRAQCERAPARMGPCEVVPNPVRVSAWPFRAVKEREPVLIGSAADTGAKRELYSAARAVLVPAGWKEEYGLVMAQALACGTPVIAYAEGAAPEIVADGETGYLVDDEAGMAAALGRLGRIDPHHCRRVAAERFDAGVVAELYERVYLKAIVRASADSRVRRFVPRLEVVR
jgi:glycosyltransferase involved in cell wall biosynthesis